MKIDSNKITSPFSSRTVEEKQVLSERLEQYKEQLNSQWLEVKEDAIDYGKKAAVISGIILGVYGLMELVLPAADEDRKSDTAVRRKPEVSRQAGFSVGNAFQSILWAAAMAWAKKKVTDFVVAEKPSDLESQE